MRNLRKYSLLNLLALSACSLPADNGGATYRVETDRPEQTIEHFGASDGWSMRFVGLWPQTEQNKIADWLFSTEMDAGGKPKGIGLSVWRFNLGAGSAEQGDNSRINYDTRTECFLRSDGTYDWGKQVGQRHFLKLAKDRGVNHFLAFMTSVPVYFTRNGLATNTGRDGTINLKDDKYGDVAKFIATAMKGLESHDGIHFDYISPFNEPDGSWNWQGPKQEGSPATNQEIARLTREINKQFVENKITTQITLNESSDIRALLGVYNTSWRRGNVVKSFFDKDSADTYVGDLSNVPKVIMAHSYWTDTPVDAMRSIRMRLRDALKPFGARYWQTELCVMSNDEEIGGGGSYDFSMKTALYVARVIHHDLVYGNACSWSWWRAVGGDYKDGLIRAYSDDSMKTGYAVDSKLLWALGNYSRFVRPGAVRYDVAAFDNAGAEVREGDTDPQGVMCSAYKNTDGKWVMVAINYSEEVRDFNFSLSNGNQRTWRMYRTSDISAESLALVGVSEGRSTLAPRSITTFFEE